MQDSNDTQEHYPYYPISRSDDIPRLRPKVTGPLPLQELAAFSTLQSMPRATVLQRCGSYVFDGIALSFLLGNPFSAFFFGILALSIGPTGPAHYGIPSPGPLGSAIAFLCIGITSLGYFFLTLCRGKTVGYAAVGITVVTPMGTLSAPRHALLPALIKTIGALLWPVLFLSLFTQSHLHWLLPLSIFLFLSTGWIVFAPQTQALYERVSGVLILDTRHHTW